jgi:hypothetical protein
VPVNEVIRCLGAENQQRSTREHPAELEYASAAGTTITSAENGVRLPTDKEITQSLSVVRMFHNIRLANEPHGAKGLHPSARSLHDENDVAQKETAPAGEVEAVFGGGAEGGRHPG